MGRQSGQMVSQQLAELVDSDVQPCQIGNETLPQIVVFHESSRTQMSAQHASTTWKLRSDAPDQDAESLFVRHVHQERSDQEPQPLAVPDLGVVEAEALEHPTEHPLAVALVIPEHVD